jgi:hypothetical protein
MNVEIGAEAALFLEKEYISGIFVAVWVIGQPVVLYRREQTENSYRERLGEYRERTEHECAGGYIF